MKRDDVPVSVYPMYGYSDDAIDELESALEKTICTVQFPRPSIFALAPRKYFRDCGWGGGVYANGIP